MKITENQERIYLNNPAVMPVLNEKKFIAGCSFNLQMFNGMNDSKVTQLVDRKIFKLKFLIHPNLLEYSKITKTAKALLTETRLCVPGWGDFKEELLPLVQSFALFKKTDYFTRINENDIWDCVILPMLSQLKNALDYLNSQDLNHGNISIKSIHVSCKPSGNSKEIRKDQLNFYLAFINPINDACFTLLADGIDDGWRDQFTKDIKEDFLVLKYIMQREFVDFSIEIDNWFEENIK